MCGLAGIVSAKQAEYNLHRVEKMLAATVSRGPDSQGVWQSEGITLGHNRLAIHDLSSDGHQPMHSACGQYTLVFNGEIYNYRELKHLLINQGITFVGTSDTEVLLACLVNWGVDKTLSCIDGMFAFAFWQGLQKQLIIARDRIGEKPLYYFDDGTEFIFASELKGVEQAVDSALEINPLAVNLYLNFSYIPAPYSIYQQVLKLLPGHYLTLSVEGGCYQIDTKEYYNFQRDIKPAEASQTSLHDLLVESVEQRLDADVAVGAFLSGGIDSSLTCAITKKALGKDVSAHTIGFEEKEFDESDYAKEVAGLLGIDHHVHTFTQQDMLNVLPNMVHTYDEPFADASQLATYLLCQKTREHVTVALSGDAGDELFAGYSRYQTTLKRWQKINQIPHLSKRAIEQIYRATEPLLRSSKMAVNSSEKLRRLMRYSSCKTVSELYHYSTSYDWQQDIHSADLLAFTVHQPSALRQLMTTDALCYLPDAILTKVDRASMAHALEVRVPFLSNEIVRFSQSLSNDELVNNSVGKWPLRELLYQYIDPSIVERPKRGFAVPLKYWLTQELKPWAQQLITNKKLQQVLPFVEHAKYLRYWQQHQAQKYDWSGQLWVYLQLLNWCAERYWKNNG